MKRCPQCQRTYPDTENFCDTDGTALVSAAAAGARRASATGSLGIECPQCGGRAEPGESVCNFCGAPLERQPAGTGASSAAAAPTQVRQEVPRAPAASPAQGATRRQPAMSQQFTGAPPEPPDESGVGRRIGLIAGYVIAAIIALGGGAWLALHFSARPTVHPVAIASPAPTPAATAAPSVALADNIAVSVTGGSEGSSARSAAAAKELFQNNKSGLLGAYKRALAADATVHDGMILRAAVGADGAVKAASVLVSTAPNPGLDADVVNTVMGWKFAPISGGSDVEISYPVVFAHGSSEAAAAESGLRTRLAALQPNETPEYASAPAPAPAASSTPAAAMATAAPTPALVRRRPAYPRHLAHARPKKPKLSLLNLVQERLRADSRLRRVNAYTDAGGTVTLYGRVFDDNSKLIAERTVRSVPGVTRVVDTLTTDLGVWADEANKVDQRLAGAGLGKVTVKIIGKDAYLSGEAKTKLEAERAVTITEAAAPVKVRMNMIRIEPGSVF